MRNTILDLGRPEQLSPPASPARERRGADRHFEDELRLADRPREDAAEAPSMAAPRRDSLRESRAGEEKVEEPRQARESVSRAADARDDAPAEDGEGCPELRADAAEEGSTDGATEAVAHDGAANAAPAQATSFWAASLPTAPQGRGVGAGKSGGEEGQAAAQLGEGVLAGATRPSRHRPGAGARGPEDDARAAPLDARAAAETAAGGVARAQAAGGNALGAPAALLDVLAGTDPAAPPAQEVPAGGVASTAAGEKPHAGSEHSTVAPRGGDDASLSPPSATPTSPAVAEHPRGAPAQPAAPAAPAGEPPVHASGPVRLAGEPGADGALLRNAAHLRVEAPGVGELELHLRVLDGVAHLRVDGDAARAVEARAGELSRALAGEGLRLGHLEVRPAAASSGSTAGSAGGEAAPDGRRGADRHGAGDDGRAAHHASPPAPPRPRAAHAPRSPGSRFGVRA